MEGWFVKVEENKFIFGKSECDNILSGITVYNSKWKRWLNLSRPATLMYSVRRFYYDADVEEGNVLIFEDKGEAKEFLELLKRFQTLNEILYWETYKTSEGFYKAKLSLQKISAKKIMYADFDQIMESFDGFEEKMEKAAKNLA